MVHFDFKKKQVTPEWLTFILTKNGFLSKGKVLFVDQQKTLQGSAIVSEFYSLSVYYTSASVGHLPSKMLMKLNQNQFYGMGQKEISFYELDINKNTTLPLATCFGTENSTETDQCCLLIEDLSHTHEPPASRWPLPPPQDQCEAAIKSLAKMHAHWWNHSNFEEPGFEMPEHWGREWVLRAEKSFPQFVNSLKDNRSEKIKTYELIFEKLHELILSTLHSPEGLTLLHGDAHFWNFLYPKNKAEIPCVIIDWQLWKVGLGAFDLSYMIALHWYPDQRRLLERYLLRYYLEEMHKQNIEYDWTEFWTEYRVSVIFNLLYPVLLHAKEVPSTIWHSHIERGFAAFEDLNCVELL
jgi:hypothetical protein